MALSLLLRMICPESSGLLALTGAGGKTTLMFTLAKALSDAGMRVLATTTTKIFEPGPDPGVKIVVARDIMALKTMDLGGGEFMIAGKCRIPDVGKLGGFTTAEVDALYKTRCFDWIIVEADGAAGKPLKASRDGEPVIPGLTTRLVHLAGLDALGVPLDADHVHRPKRFSENSDLPLGAMVDEVHMARGLACEMEKNRRGRENMDAWVLLNKADDPDRVRQAEPLALTLLSLHACRGVMITALKDADPVKMRLWVNHEI